MTKEQTTAREQRLKIKYENEYPNELISRITGCVKDIYFNIHKEASNIIENEYKLKYPNTMSYFTRTGQLATITICEINYKSQIKQIDVTDYYSELTQGGIKEYMRNQRLKQLLEK